MQCSPSAGRALELQRAHEGVVQVTLRQTGAKEHVEHVATLSANCLTLGCRSAIAVAAAALTCANDAREERVAPRNAGAQLRVGSRRQGIGGPTSEEIEGRCGCGG